MMSIVDDFILVCLESIVDEDEKKKSKNLLRDQVEILLKLI